VRSYGAAPIRSLASRSTSAWARAWRLARRKSTSPAIPALRSTSKSATLSIATVFGSSSALDGYPNARNHAVALLSRCHRIYTTFRDLDCFTPMMLQVGAGAYVPGYTQEQWWQSFAPERKLWVRPLLRYGPVNLTISNITLGCWRTSPKLPLQC